MVAAGPEEAVAAVGQSQPASVVVVVVEVSASWRLSVSSTFRIVNSFKAQVAAAVTVVVAASGAMAVTEVSEAPQPLVDGTAATAEMVATADPPAVAAAVPVARAMGSSTSGRRSTRREPPSAVEQQAPQETEARELGPTQVGEARTASSTLGCLSETDPSSF